MTGLKDRVAKHSSRAHATHTGLYPEVTGPGNYMTSFYKAFYFQQQENITGFPNTKKRAKI